MNRTMDFCVTHRAEYLGGAGCEVWVAIKEERGYPTPCEIERGKWTAVEARDADPQERRRMRTETHGEYGRPDTGARYSLMVNGVTHYFDDEAAARAYKANMDSLYGATSGLVGPVVKMAAGDSPGQGLMGADLPRREPGTVALEDDPQGGGEE